MAGFRGNGTATLDPLRTVPSSNKCGAFNASTRGRSAVQLFPGCAFLERQLFELQHARQQSDCQVEERDAYVAVADR